jgi:hypothetical protein
LSLEDDRRPLYRLVALTAAVVIGIGVVAALIVAVVLLLL